MAMRSLFVGLTILSLLPGRARDEYVYTTLDDFEDVSAWTKGDPTTDMEQREVGYAPSAKFVRQGKQSLAFMVRVDWSEKPGQKYARGWPMVSRTFERPRDWSRYDRLEFWVYTETQADLPARALRCGIGTPDGKPGKWHDISLTPNEWRRIVIPLTEDRDWTKVTGVWFYLAEAWYRDGDRINFYFDDMRLGSRVQPAILECRVSARTHRRGEAADLLLLTEGPVQDVRVRASIVKRGAKEAAWEAPLASRRHTYTVPLDGSSPGGHQLRVGLVGPGDQVYDRARLYFRIMQPRKRTYLSLITFYTPHVMNAKAEQMAVINGTPYEGVAVPLVGAYDTEPVPDYAAYAEQIAMLKETCEYDVWPWVFSNRIIARVEEGRTHSGVKGPGPEYFRRINCLDLDDAAGARSDMLKIWRHAVRMARELGAPGIVVDLEAYNNYRTYSLQYVAQHRGETVGKVARACEAIGADLARIVEQEYPRCIVWSLFSRLKPTDLKADDYQGPLCPVPGHITLGFLRYCKRHRVPAKFLCGGEVEVGYYNPDVDALKKRIAARDAAYEAPLREFPDHFFLAGTISPYHDHTILTSWIKRAAGDDPALKTIEDFQPMFETLFHAYDWVWIYASSAARTMPYDPQRAKTYGDVLRRALNAAGQ